MLRKSIERLICVVILGKMIPGVLLPSAIQVVFIQIYTQACCLVLEDCSQRISRDCVGKGTLTFKWLNACILLISMKPSI